MNSVNQNLFDMVAGVCSHREGLVCSGSDSNSAVRGDRTALTGIGSNGILGGSLFGIDEVDMAAALIQDISDYLIPRRVGFFIIGWGIVFFCGCGVTFDRKLGYNVGNTVIGE